MVMASLGLGLGTVGIKNPQPVLDLTTVPMFHNEAATAKVYVPNNTIHIDGTNNNAYAIDDNFYDPSNTLAGTYRTSWRAATARSC